MRSNRHFPKREEAAKMDLVTRLINSPTLTMQDKVAQMKGWWNSYKQRQETGVDEERDEERDEKNREAPAQREKAGAAGASAAGRDIAPDAKRAIDDVSNTESAPPAKKAKGPPAPSAPPEDEATGPTPTLQQIFKQFHEHDRNKGRNLEWLDMLECNCQKYGWSGDEAYCESGDRSTFGSAYLKLHGVEELCHNIGQFLSYFAPRKMSTPEFKDMKRCAATLRALVKFCISRGYLEKDDAHVKDTLKRISVSGNFDAEGVQMSLERLKDAGYWKRLRAEREDDGDTDHEAYDEFDYDCECDSWSDHLNDNYPVEGDEFGMADDPAECASVRKNGWVFKKGFSRGGRNRVLLYLPPEVAKMGREAMEISCMDFVYIGRGVWEPKGWESHGGKEYVCANVYPP